MSSSARMSGCGWSRIHLALALIFSVLSHANAACNLCNTSLSFVTAKAGRVSGLRITFLLDDVFEQLDTVTFKLPEFSRADGTEDLSNIVDASGTVGIAAFTLARWNEPNSLLTLTHITPVTIPANTLISLLVRADAGIALPVNGVVGDDPNFQIRTDTRYQNTVFEPILSTQAVGVLYNTSLTYGSEEPNGVTSLDVNFTFSANLQPGDTITLLLDSFTIGSTTTFTSSATICSDPYLVSKSCSSGNISGIASSPGGGVSVSFAFSDPVLELESVTLLIPSSVGISLPPLGTSENNPLLTIQTDALEGPVETHPIESSEYVPRITLSYDPPRAGTGECDQHSVADGSCLTFVDEGTDITFTMTYSLAMAANDTVVLSLPSFTRSTYQQTLPSAPITEIPCVSCNVANFALTGTSAAVLRGGSWNEATETLTVTFGAAVASQRLISFTIPASVGLILPFPAIKDDPALTYEVQAAAGTLSATPITSSPAIGAFVESVGASQFASTSLSMAEARVGVPGSLTLVFKLTSDLATGQCIGFCGTQDGVPIVASVVREVIGPELVLLTLPGFSRAGGDIGLIPTDSSSFSTASWDESSSVLKLSSSAATPGGTEVTVTIGPSAGIRVPTSGLELNTNALKIATNAAIGPVVNTAVAGVQAVGFLSNTALSVSPRKAGVAVEINVTVTYSQFIRATESFTLSLPGYTRDSTLPTTLTVSAWVGGTDFAVYADWAPAGPSITLVVGAGGIAAGSELLVIIGESNGIVLREEGMAALAPRKLWRARNAAAVPGGWLVAELAFYADKACTQRLFPLDPAASNVASVGAGLASLDACRNFTFAPASSGGCGANNSNTRAAFVGELAACKEILCTVGFFPEYLVGQGAAGAYILGRGHGCVVGDGGLPSAFSAGADEICVASTLPAAHATDNSSQTFWWAGVDSSNATATLEGYVGVEFSDPEAVACVGVEQGMLTEGANYSASSVIIEASDDGVRWWGVLGGPLGEGVAQVKDSVSVDSLAYAAPTLASDAFRGPVQATELESTPAIGSFAASTSLSFGNAVAGQPSSLLLSLAPQMEIAAGEAFQLSLPGFTRDPTVTGPLNVTVASYFPPADGSGSTAWELRESTPLGASWDDASSTVTVVLSHTVFANYSLSVSVDAASALTLPPLGIAPSSCGLGPDVQPGFRRRSDGTLEGCGSCAGCSGANEHAFTLATNATAGPVLAEPGTVLRTVQRVGVITNASLELSLLSPDFPVDITLNFTFNRPLTPGVSFVLDLPLFLGAPNASATLSSSLFFSEVQWDRSAGQLTLIASAHVDAMTPITVTIPSSLGIQLPAEGLMSGSSVLRLSTDSGLGAVLPVTIGAAPAVGAFTGDVTRLAYTPAEFETDGSPLGEGRIASIAIGFSLNRRIAIGEYVALYLIGFSRAAGDLASLAVTDHNVTNLDLNFTTVDTNGVFSAFVTASWSEASSTLFLFASKNVAADQRHVVLVPASAGIRLPKLGLVENDPRILISTNAAAGPNTGTPVRRSPALKKVCAAECSAWAFTCAGCDCGACASDGEL